MSEKVKFVIFRIKTCKDDSYVSKTKLFITEIPEKHYLLFLKSKSQSNDFYHRFNSFALEIKCVTTKAGPLR